MNENNSFDSVIPHFDSTIQGLGPCIMLKLIVLRCLPAKEILRAGSSIQGFRAPFFSKCGPERLRVFQAKSWLSVTHLWNYDWFLEVCSRRWMKSNKNRHRSQEQQQQNVGEGWSSVTQPPIVNPQKNLLLSLRILLLPPHSVILHTHTQVPGLKLKDGDPGLSSFRPLAPAFDIFTWQEPRRSNFWWVLLERGVYDTSRPAAHVPYTQVIHWWRAFFVFKHFFEPFLPSQLPLHATHCSRAPGSTASVAARLKVPPRVPWREIGQLDHTPTVAGHHTSIGTHLWFEL